MQRQPPIVRCFGALCFGCAITLATLAWRNPFPDPVVTPDSLVTVAGTQEAQATEIEAANGRSPISNLFSGSLFSGGLWSRAEQPQTQIEPPVQSTVRLILSLKNRSLAVNVPGAPPVYYDVAVGQDDWQTPTGSFTIMSKIENPAWQHPITKEAVPPGPDNPLGERWIGFWSNGDSQIGFHGTNQEELIGEAVSHGCVRMRNEDIRSLYELVNIGTAVEVVLQ